MQITVFGAGSVLGSSHVWNYQLPVVLRMEEFVHHLLYPICGIKVVQDCFIHRSTYIQFPTPP